MSSGKGVGGSKPCCLCSGQPGLRHGAVWSAQALLADCPSSAAAWNSPEPPGPSILLLPHLLPPPPHALTPCPGFPAHLAALDHPQGTEAHSWASVLPGSHRVICGHLHQGWIRGAGSRWQEIPQEPGKAADAYLWGETDTRRHLRGCLGANPPCPWDAWVLEPGPASAPPQRPLRDPCPRGGRTWGCVFWSSFQVGCRLPRRVGAPMHLLPRPCTPGCAHPPLSTARAGAAGAPAHRGLEGTCRR